MRSRIVGWVGAVVITLSVFVAFLLRMYAQDTGKPTATENLDWPAYGGGPLNNH